MNRVLTDSQRAQFFGDGWTVVPDLLAPAELEPLRQEIAACLDRCVDTLHAEGKLEDRRESEPFETRLTRLLDDRPDLRGTYLRALEGKGGGGHAGPALFGVLTHPRLLDAMEDLLGPELVGSSVYRIRPKVPGLDRGVVPWHQDSGYFAAHCDESLIVTVWMPLVDATPQNGCLQVLPGVHRQGVMRHHTGGHAGYLVIQDDDLPTGEPVTAPVPRGGALLLTNLTPHRSTDNTTDVIRWSIDLRYQGADVPNNVDADLTALTDADPGVTIACYPPEGDFVVRSAAHPERVSDHADFQRRRLAFEQASLPGPRRGWTPIS